ncbi:MAG: hypothetical protein RSD04_01445 [Clostridia bacterium]
MTKKCHSQLTIISTVAIAILLALLVCLSACGLFLSRNYAVAQGQSLGGESANCSQSNANSDLTTGDNDTQNSTQSNTNGDLSSSDEQKTERLATAQNGKTQLEPTIKYTIPYGEIISLGNTIDSQTKKVAYSGKDKYKTLTIGWATAGENLPRATAVCRNSKSEIVNINELAIADTYTITLELTHPDFELAQGKNVFYFTISPCKITVQSLEFVSPSYDKTPHLAKAEISGAFYDNDNVYSLVYRQNVNGVWTDFANGQLPVDAGTYQLEIVANNANYVFVGENSVEKNITPRQLKVVFDMPNLIFDGQDKDITNVKYLGALEGDKVNISYTYRKNGETVTPNTVGDYYIDFSSDNANYAPPKTENFSIKQQIISLRVQLPTDCVYDGEQKPVTVTSQLPLPQGLTIAIYYSSSVTQTLIPPTTVGNFSIRLELQGKGADQYKVEYDETSFTITPRHIAVTFTSPLVSTFSNSEQPLQFVLSNIVDGDKTLVGCNLRYNGGGAPPFNAGNYVTTIEPFGEKASNYVFDLAPTTFVINKADYPYTAFSASITAKLLTISTEFGSVKLAYCVDGKNWQDKNTFLLDAMLHLDIQVKLIGDGNHNEKILTQKFFTGFDSVIFNDMLASVNLDNFSFEQMKLAMEIMLDKGYISPNDLANIDQAKLAQIEKKYNELRALTESVIVSAQTAYSSIFFQGAVAMALTGLGSCALVIGAVKRKELLSWMEKHQLAIIASAITLVIVLTIALGLGLGITCNSHNYLLKDMRSVDFEKFGSHIVSVSQNGEKVFEQRDNLVINDFQLNVKALVFDNDNQGFAIEKSQLKKFKKLSSDGDNYIFVGQIKAPSEFAGQNIDTMTVTLGATKTAVTDFVLNSVQLTYQKNGFDITLTLSK